LAASFNRCLLGIKTRKLEKFSLDLNNERRFFKNTKKIFKCYLREGPPEGRPSRPELNFFSLNERSYRETCKSKILDFSNVLVKNGVCNNLRLFKVRPKKLLFFFICRWYFEIFSASDHHVESRKVSKDAEKNSLQNGLC